MPMPEWVLDSSAILALLNDEAGAPRVEEVLARGIMSSVNLAEVATKLIEKGASEAQVREIIGALGCPVAEFEIGQALEAGYLRRQTREKGLSLGDRACLALGRQRGLPIMTTDRAWKELDVDVSIEFIR